MELEIRAASSNDAEDVARLLGDLGYPTPVAAAGQRLERLSSSGTDWVLVGDVGGQVAGLVAFHRMLLLHGDGIIGRVTALVVDEEHRRGGVGARLLRVAEDRLRAMGCVRVELTSGARREDAHHFYERQGYTSESKRFVKIVGGTSAK